jgi:hypothetical protein
MAAGRIPNPHWAGAPGRMSDARLFTDYRASCSLLPNKAAGGLWPEMDRKLAFMGTGMLRVGADRSLTVLRAGTTGCVDTMVPELNKRIYDWRGGLQGIAQPVGVGTGRLYLPGRPDLITADPDTIAMATIPNAMLPGTFASSPELYGPAMSMPLSATPVVPARHNRYSAPYGNA